MIQAVCGSDANILNKCIQNALLTDHVVRQMPGVSEGACLRTHARTHARTHMCTNARYKIQDTRNFI